VKALARQKQCGSNSALSEFHVIDCQDARVASVASGETRKDLVWQQWCDIGCMRTLQRRTVTDSSAMLRFHGSMIGIYSLPEVDDVHVLSITGEKLVGDEAEARPGFKNRPGRGVVHIATCSPTRYRIPGPRSITF
jgi:hypothetical protein